MCVTDFDELGLDVWLAVLVILGVIVRLGVRVWDVEPVVLRVLVIVGEEDRLGVFDWVAVIV